MVRRRSEAAGSGAIVLIAVGGLIAVGLIALASLVALGGGSIIGLPEPSTGAASPERSFPGDVLVTTALDAAEVELRAQSADVAALAGQARAALTALNGGDLDAVAAAAAAGNPIVARIRTRHERLSVQLSDPPGPDPARAVQQVSDPVAARAGRLRAALPITEPLDAAWDRLTTDSLRAMRLSSLLTSQVDTVLDAAALGRNARYQEAVEVLAKASEAIRDARRVRDRLATTIDVTVLDEWLDRNEAYGAALGDLYLALDAGHGRVTRRVRAAAAAERDAKASLPADSRGLSLIMTEIGRGGMDGAVIAIEQARRDLAAAVGPS